MKEYTVRVYKCGRQEWRLYGTLHREDGPAIIHHDYQSWWINGKRHREDGPACINDDDYQSWWINGKRHREDGPAIINGNCKEYWINGKQLTEDEFNNRNAKELTVAEINKLLGYNVKIVDE